jgi:excisionase family DNA binding protein
VEPAHRTTGSLDSGGVNLETHVNVKAAARFLGASPSLVYAYVERKQIPHYRMMGRTIRFRISELAKWRQQFHVNGGIDE